MEQMEQMEQMQQCIDACLKAAIACEHLSA